MGLTLVETDRPPEPVDDMREYRESLTLDGEWRFRKAYEGDWRTAQVPGCWESQFPDMQGWAGTVIYERKFRLPESFRGKRVRIRFAAVDFFTEVWVNDRAIGMHEGGYTPFEFDINEALIWDAENTVRVRVTDATPDTDAQLPDGSGTLAFAEIPHGKQSWYTPVSGIWQSVTLEARPAVYLERVHIRANADTGRAVVRATLSNAILGDWRLRVTVIGPDGSEVARDVKAEFRAAEAEAVAEVPDVQLWAPEHPHLYQLTAELLHDEVVVDRRDERFGFRKIETKEGHIWLNDRPYFIIGALDQAFYPKTIYTAPSREYLRDQFEKAKEMGLNLMRCHIKVPSEDYLELCDELGLLVWYEIPNGSKLTLKMRERARRTFVDMLDRDANHPSIVIMSIMNESWGIDLSDEEQRQWLADSYHWAKKAAPDKLIVDNSACIPNFHVVSDLDDYHVYYNIPDQAADYAEWVKAFAERTAGSYSGFGDAFRHHKEPLLISEFGNWGIPRLGPVFEAEGGEEPWWFDTGEGITRPAGVFKRFADQGLSRAFKSLDELADASQEQEWLALKYQIEEMRRRREVAGYVITEFTDINWEVNGLLDFARNPKIFHHRLQHLQQQNILIPRPERYSYWSGEEVHVMVELSKFSDVDTEGGRIEWSMGELSGEIPVHATPSTETSLLGTITFRAPEVRDPQKTAILLVLRGRDGSEIARTDQRLVIAPSSMKTWGHGRKVWVYDPLGVAEDLPSRLSTCGFEVLESPASEALGILTQWDSVGNEHMAAGGRAILAVLHPKSLTIASGLNLRVADRTLNNWWGDWCSSQTWFVPSAFPYLPDVQKFDFEFAKVVPERVIWMAPAEATLSGIFVGWLRNPGAYVVRIPVGKGRMVATTFEVTEALGDDPVATLMLACLDHAVA